MSGTVYRFRGFTVNPGAHGLLKEGLRIPIQEQPFQVLLALLACPGQVVTRESLRCHLWGTDTFVDFDQSLNSAVRRLRLALEDNSRAPIYVETVPRVGFRFLPAVTTDVPLSAGAPSSDDAPGSRESLRPHVAAGPLPEPADPRLSALGTAWRR